MDVEEYIKTDVGYGSDADYELPKASDIDGFFYILFKAADVLRYAMSSDLASEHRHGEVGVTLRVEPGLGDVDLWLKVNGSESKEFLTSPMDDRVIKRTDKDGTEWLLVANM